MATTVGNETTLDDLLTDLIQLDHDAADAYQAAIDRIEDQGCRSALSAFKQDHLRHIEELGEFLSRRGKTPPTAGDMKAYLAKGKVVMGGLIGDKAILQAMKTNEDDTNTAYERAVQHRDAMPDLHACLQQGLGDERRHRDWMIEQIKKIDRP
ncbi:MAG TPA: DUF892 family protein [Stellaceae bacterium]|nr:DUF892 family protein [Stellaceae bacterium]